MVTPAFPPAATIDGELTFERISRLTCLTVEVHCDVIGNTARREMIHWVVSPPLIPLPLEGGGQARIEGDRRLIDGDGRG